jgi:hypothetical protein
MLIQCSLRTARQRVHVICCEELRSVRDLLAVP